jgi:hypothetical protein
LAFGNAGLYAFLAQGVLGSLDFFLFIDLF